MLINKYIILYYVLYYDLFIKFEILSLKWYINGLFT